MREPLQNTPSAAPRVTPAKPLWRLAPTRDGHGHCLADFMMLIPGLGARPHACRDQVADTIREVCQSYGEQVVFADINFSINVLWVSVAAEPGLAGRVAQSIRQRVPDALLIGGQLGAATAIQAPPDRRRSVWWRRLSRRVQVMLKGPAA